MSRVGLVLWLVLLPLAAWPGTEGRSLQIMLLPVVGLAVVGLTLARHAGPLRWAGISAIVLAALVALSPFQPMAIIPTLAVLAVATLLLVSVEVSSGILVGGLALLCGVHLVCLAAEAWNLNPLQWITYWGSPLHSVYWPSLMGITHNPGTAAALLAVTLPWVVVSLMGTHQSHQAIAGACLFAVPFLAVIAFLSIRQFGGPAALCCGLLVACLAVRPRWAWAVAGVSACGLLAFHVGVHPAGYAARLLIIPQVLGQICSSWTSVAIGHGIGSWELHAMGLQGFPEGGLFLQVHNDWLQLWFEGGAALLVPMAMLAATILHAFWTSQDRVIGTAGLVSTTAWLATSLVLFPMHLASMSVIGVAILLIAHRVTVEAHHAT
jgi:hypothetical protein